MQRNTGQQQPRWSSLEAVAAQIRDCALCGLAAERTNAVPGEGSASPVIAFVGEGPGFYEDQQGRPFVGRAGRLLDELLELAPLRREDVFITNIVKCRPPENRDPLPDEVAACWPYLEAQLRLLDPRVIATLGRHSLTRFFPDARISEAHGRALRWRDRVVFPLYHPAAALRSGRLREVLEEDMRKLPAAVIEALRIGAASEPQPPAETPGAGPAAETRQEEDTDDKPQLSLF